MEYYQYFRLEGPPFQPASRDGAVYFSPTHVEGLATLEAGLSGELNGLTLLTGEAGTGKTTLIYSMLLRDYKRVRIAHIDDPKLSFLEIMQLILTQLKLYSSGSTKLDYLKTLDHLLELHGNEERIAIIVDEAQVLSDDVLEELRLLWNRGQRNDRCLMQVILVGQPEFAERLKKPQLRQLNQRISSRGVLKPLNHAQAVTYVECKLSAQGSKCSTIFEPRALTHLLRYSDGIPRKINMLCHNAMLAGFHELERKVSVGTAKKVAAEYQDSVGIKYQRSVIRRLLMPALAVGGASLLLLGVRNQQFWWGWVHNHIVTSGGAAERTLEPIEIVEQAQAAKHLKTAERPRIDGHKESDAKPKVAVALALHPVALQASPAPAATASSATAASATPKNDFAGSATAPGIALFATAPASAAVSGGIQQPAGIPAAPQQRSQTAVRVGDTLEKIAIRYFGSSSGINGLIKANPQLTNINQLSVGQIIYLPLGIKAKASPVETSIAPAARNADGSQE